MRSVRQSPGRDRSAPVETDGGNVSDGDLEAAIVRAVTLGAVDVARVLAGQLEERRRARVPGNVVDFASERRKM